MLTVLSVYIFNTILLSVHKNKISFQIFALVSFFILLVFTEHNNDYAAYEKVFRGGKASFSEAVGLLWVFDLLKLLGFTNYKIALAVVGLFIGFVFYKWNQFSKNVFYVIYLYMLFIAFYDIIQIRNAIIAFMTMYAILLFLQGNSKLVALIPCVIAPLFHVLAAFIGMIVVYVFCKKPRKDYSLSGNEVFVFIWVGVFACFSKGILILLMDYIPQLLKASIYFTHDVDSQSFIIWFSASVIQIFALWNYGIRFVLSKSNKVTSVKKKRAINILFRFALFAIPLSGVTLWMDEIVRVFRIFFLAMFFLYAIMRDELTARNRLIIFLILAGVNISFMMGWLMRGIDPDAYWG